MGEVVRSLFLPPVSRSKEHEQDRAPLLLGTGVQEQEQAKEREMDNRVQVHVTGSDPERVRVARGIIRDALTASGWESTSGEPKRRHLRAVHLDEAAR